LKLNAKKIIKNNILGLIVAITSISMVVAASTLPSSSISYDNSESGGSSNTVSGALDELYDKAPTSFKIGDYVQMTPTKTSFTIPKNLTGYTSDQIINPSELNLWRVIKINDDKTADMVSEYVSIGVSFYSLTGYQNLIGTLNFIAKQYRNSKYTVASRHMGYNGQTEYITNTSKFVYPDPWTATTSNNSNEVLGGGDIMHTTDTNLVNTAIGTLKASRVDTQGSENGNYYWLASREYNYIGTSKYRWCGRRIDTTGAFNITYFYSYYLYGFGSNEYKNTTAAIRPILTLKSGIKVEGEGTASSPYILD